MSTCSMAYTLAPTTRKERRSDISNAELRLGIDLYSTYLKERRSMTTGKTPLLAAATQPGYAIDDSTTTASPAPALYRFENALRQLNWQRYDPEDRAAHIVLLMRKHGHYGGNIYTTRSSRGPREHEYLVTWIDFDDEVDHVIEREYADAHLCNIEMAAWMLHSYTPVTDPMLDRRQQSYKLAVALATMMVPASDDYDLLQPSSSAKVMRYIHPDHQALRKSGIPPHICKQVRTPAP